MRSARDDIEDALDDMHRALQLAREAKDPQTLVPALGVAARVFIAAGRIDEARALGRELLATPRLAGEYRIVEFAFVADRLGFGSEVKNLLEHVRPQNPWTRGGIALVDGDYAAAADTFHEIGDLEFEAEARFHAGEKLVAEGRRGDADEQLTRALAFFRSVRATRFIREAEALLSAPVEGRRSITQ
jgi:tetratricopeptide (TPR) repeat protein